MTKGHTPDDKLNVIKDDIQDANAKLTALLNAAVDAIIIIDHTGKVELFNAAAEKMFGYQSNEVVGSNVNMLMPEPYQSEHDQFLHNYMHTNKARIIGIGREVKAQKNGGEIFPIELSVGEVKDSSHKQFVGIIRDISGQVKAHADAILNRDRLAHVTRLSTIGEMAAGIAHEINQPLTAVSNYAQACKNMLSRDSSNPAESDFQQRKLFDTLEKINKQAQRASEVIRRLRALVKKRTSKRELVDLNELIEDTIDLAKIDTRLLEHGIKLHLTIDPKPQLTVDPILIQQVLFNLIRNAIDAMEEQTNKAVHIHSRWLNQWFIEVAVSDAGHGVSEKHKDTLFTPFFTTKTTGMGMGLPISQSIVQSHGGDLKHHPREPEGSVFIFTLPAKPIIDTVLETKIND